LHAGSSPVHGSEEATRELTAHFQTTIGAVKAALHRARERLRPEEDPPASRRAPPSPALVERFIERLNESDLSGAARAHA